ncbi:MAG: S-formylglutathione hydrolase [Myxococcales bacterium]|nr:S-formylglutathione hydrolase [Myxococcales bacterium]
MSDTTTRDEGLETIREQRCHGGVQGVYQHRARATQTTMRFSVFVPPQAARAPAPVLYFLSGLTCTEDNFTVKAGAQRYAAARGLILVAPDTSPRGDDVPDDEAYDLGQGAGFYLDATQAPWSRHFQMETYVVHELPALIERAFPARPGVRGITGHSMGGHGALTLALRNPGAYASVSALAPIASPLACPWGHKAFTAYLGEDRARWAEHDATALLRARGPMATLSARLLVDQGDADGFLRDQLKPELLDAACAEVGQALTLRMQPGYDHSYFFVNTFIGDHVAHHADALR